MGKTKCCCGGPCSCNTDCDPYLPDPTWTITVLGRTVVLNRTPGTCMYLGIECWKDSATEVNSWTEDTCTWVNDLVDVGDPEVDPPAPPCPVSCCSGSGFSHDTLQYQIAVKVAQKRWRQVLHRIDAQIYAVNDAGSRVSSASCTTKLRLSIDYTVITIYYYGFSAYGWVRWRKKTVTCGSPVTETIGSWNHGAEPTMPTVEKPHKFNWCPGDSNFLGNADGFCVNDDLIEGPVNECLSDWPTTVVTTLNELYCNGYGVCSQRTVNGIVPVDVTEQKCDSFAFSTIQLLAGCSELACPLHCDESMAKQSYKWLSTIFDCTDIPSELELTNTLSAPPSGSFYGSCGSQTFSYVYPSVESSTISATI
jgi:hypothetical protein